MLLRSVISKQSLVSPNMREQMFTLYSHYFDNVRFGTFIGDMKEKSWIIMLKNRSNELVGFSTVQTINTVIDQKNICVLFSGDTVVDKPYWRSSALAGAFGHIMLRLISQSNGFACYWLLISKGYKTYRFLPVFFNEFYPTHNKQTPYSYRKIMDRVCTEKFGPVYKPGSGILELAWQKERLKPCMCNIGIKRYKDPHIAFFLKKNPGYYTGNELVCIADVSKKNLNSRAARVIDAAEVVWHE